MAMNHVAAFCAICASDRGPFAQRPLGKNNAMVAVCSRCDEEHPTYGGYSFEGGRSVGDVFGDRRIGAVDGNGNSRTTAHKVRNR